MNWLMLNAGFAQSPKFAGWRAAEKWALVELLLYCVHQRSGRVPEDARLLPRSVTSALLTKAERSGWLDRDEQGLVVHDWGVEP